MSAALCLLLAGQLASFEVTPPIPSPQYVGDSFEVQIIAKDPYGALYPYNGEALLSTTRDNYWSYVYPRVVVFRNGVCDTLVMVTLAENMALICRAGGAGGQSNFFDVFTGAPFRLLAILPGESLAPGSPVGRLPRQPSTQVAGDSFLFTTYLTDVWFNPVEFRSDSVYFSSTDTFAQLPAGGTLNNGSGRFPATVRQAGTQRLVVCPSEQQAFLPDTSTAFAVVPGPLANLLLLLPGEYPLPGDNATAPWQTPGKGGEPEVQYVRAPFASTVYPVDRCWNRVTAPSLGVALHSDFAFSSSPAETTLVDSAWFTVEYQTPGPNQNIWTTAEPGDYESYRSQLEVRARGQRLDVVKPDTVDAGETAAVRVTVRDANGDPIATTVCRFSVVQGSGGFVWPEMLTDTIGIVTNQFVCTRGRFAEHDSILISSGGADTLVGIYVYIPDSVVMQGKIIAFPNPFGFERDATEIFYYLQRSAPTTVTIYDPFGNEVIAWRFRQGEPGAKPGLNRLVWDGRNRRGLRVASGIYVIQVLGEMHTGTTFKNWYRIGVAW